MSRSTDAQGSSASAGTLSAFSPADHGVQRVRELLGGAAAVQHACGARHSARAMPPAALPRALRLEAASTDEGPREERAGASRPATRRPAAEPRALPITLFVSPADVMRALACSRSLAYEH